MSVKGCKKCVLYFLIILITLCPVLTEVSVYADTADICFKLTKTKFLPLEAFSVTAENIPENEITSLVLISAKNTDLHTASLVYCFQGSTRSVIKLCAPRTAGTYKFILIKGNLNRDEKPVILAGSQEFEVSKVKPSAEELAYKDIDCYDVLSRQGMSDFGPIQLFHDGNKIKGFSPWNNMNLTGKVIKTRDDTIRADLQWVTYTSEGLTAQTGSMVLNITPDGERMYGRYRTGKSEYWTKMESDWYCWPSYDPINKNSVIFCREKDGLKLLWNPIVQKGIPSGYNVYSVNSKGLISKKQLNKNPVKDVCFSLNMSDMSPNYIVKAINADGSETAVTQVSSTANLYECPMVVNGDDMYSETAILKDKNIVIQPYSFLSSLKNEYNCDQKGKEKEIFKVVESPSGDSLTLSYKKRYLVITAGSKYYKVNGKTKSWGYILKKEKDKGGLEHFEIPLAILSEAFGFKTEKTLEGNLINITFAL